MLKVDGFVYKIFSWVYNFMLLNILFIVSSILVVTVFPATAALFGVARQWVKGNEVNVFQQFRIFFKENLKQSIFVGFLTVFVCMFLTADFYALTILKISYKPILFTVLVIVSFCVWATFLNIYSLMVNGYYTNKLLIINAFKISFYQPHLTFVQAILTLAWGYLSLRFGFLIFFVSFSAFAFFTYWLTERKLNKILALKG